MNLILCEKCGSEMQGKIIDSTSGLFCTNCDWCVVTSYIPEIAQDITEYYVFLLDGDPNNIDHIKMLSSLGGINYLQAKKMIKSEKPLIFKGEALEVCEVLRGLDSFSITYQITPDFPYDCRES